MLWYWKGTFWSCRTEVKPSQFSPKYSMQHESVKLHLQSQRLYFSNLPVCDFFFFFRYPMKSVLHQISLNFLSTWMTPCQSRYCSPAQLAAHQLVSFICSPAWGCSACLSLPHTAPPVWLTASGRSLWPPAKDPAEREQRQSTMIQSFSGTVAFGENKNKPIDRRWRRAMQ